MSLGAYATTVVAALALSLVTYSAKWMRNGERFKPVKFLRTILVGLIVGVYAASADISLTLQNFETVATSIGAIAIAEQAAKSIYRAIRRAYRAARQ